MKSCSKKKSKGKKYFLQLKLEEKINYELVCGYAGKKFQK